MTPTAEILARDLLRKAFHLKALCDHAPGVVPFGMARAKREVGDAAVVLEAELAKPLKLTPWTPHSPRNACPDYKPGSPL